MAVDLLSDRVRDPFDIAHIMGTLYGDGIMALARAFPRVWVERLRSDIDALFAKALAIPGGALPRGPDRFYVEVAPESLSGFVDIATHPWFVAVSTAILGPCYQIVEVGFDVPGPGAADQPWHRDFAAPEATVKGRRLNSLAFNLTAVDTVADMGPLEIALGTQWDDLSACDRGMFPTKDLYPRYAERMTRKLPQMGDMSARSALTIHRGTANRSHQSRPVLVVGVDAPDATNHEHHDLQVTRAYETQLPPAVRDRLKYRLVDEIEHIVQAHVIDGLLQPYEE